MRLLRTIGGIDFTGQERAALNKLTMPLRVFTQQRLVSASRRIVTICSSVNRVFFMAPSLSKGAILSSVNWPEKRQAGQGHRN